MIAELKYKLKAKKFQKIQNSFAKRYKHCNRCETHLNLTKDEEIVCALCGETFCTSCITKHQKYCYGN